MTKGVLAVNLNAPAIVEFAPDMVVICQSINAAPITREMVESLGAPAPVVLLRQA